MLRTGNVLWLRLSGVCGVLTPVVAFVCIFLAIGSAPGFIWTENALSDLGVVPGVTSVLFNYGLIASGILGFVFATSLFGVMRFFEVFSADSKPHIPVFRGLGGALFFSLACLTLIAIGVFPESVGSLHTLASVAFFVALIISLGCLGIEFWQVRQKPWAAFTLLLGIVATVPWLLLFFVRYVLGLAVPEFVSAVAGGAWTAVFGCKMLKMSVQNQTGMASL